MNIVGSNLWFLKKKTKKKQDSFINRWLTYELKISYMSPCPRRLLLLQPVGRRTCRWLLWSSRCSPAPWWCGGAACGRGGPRWGLPRQQPSGGSLESWTSLSPVTVPRPLWRNLMGGYRGLYWRNVDGPDKVQINTILYLVLHTVVSDPANQLPCPPRLLQTAKTSSEWCKNMYGSNLTSGRPPGLHLYFELYKLSPWLSISLIVVQSYLRLLWKPWQQEKCPRHTK